MAQFWLSIAVTLGALSSWRAPFRTQFVGVTGQTVEVSIDRGPVEAVAAGKLQFRDAFGNWKQTVCAEVRSTILLGQVFAVQQKQLSQFPRLTRAARIVARFFRSARTPDECAGLQLAVWKAIEDGGADPDFNSGHLMAHAAPSVIGYAKYYYHVQADAQDDIVALGGITFFQSTGDGGQSQLGLA